MLLVLLLLPRPISPRCATIGGDECVLPFRYQGRLYHACTGDDSDNGAPWCAVQVSRSGGDRKRSAERNKPLHENWFLWSLLVPIKMSLGLNPTPRISPVFCHEF